MQSIWRRTLAAAMLTGAVLTATGAAPAADPYLTTTSVNVRTAPASGAAVHSVLPALTDVAVAGTSGSWSQIKLDGGTYYLYSISASGRSPMATGLRLTPATRRRATLPRSR